MIQAPNELRSVAVGATVNLFVSVGQTSRRLKGTVSRTRARGSTEEVLEVHVSERTPGGSEIVFWLGYTDDETFLLPMDSDGESLVYATYEHGGGKTGLYVDSVREVAVRRPESDDDETAGAVTGASETRTGSDGGPEAAGSELDGAAPEREHGPRR